MTEEMTEAVAPAETTARKHVEAMGGVVRHVKPSPPTVPMGARGVVLQSFEDLQRFAKMCVESGAAPKGMTQGGAAVAIQAGLERGLGLLGGLQAFVIVDGNLSWRGKAAIAAIRNSPAYKRGSLDFGVDGEGDDRYGWAVAQRSDEAKARTVRYSVKDAKRAQLWAKSNWTKHPDRMLQWRAIGHLADDLFSDVLGGFPLAESVYDFDEPKERASVGRPASLPPPSAPDPLIGALGGGKESPGEVIDLPEAPTPERIEESIEFDGDDEPKCEHGVTLDMDCADCDEADAAAARRLETES